MESSQIRSQLLLDKQVVKAALVPKSFEFGLLDTLAFVFYRVPEAASIDKSPL
jgi:hypothetical protein